MMKKGALTMAEKDLVLDAGNTPAYDDILTYINEPALTRWKTLNSYIQEKYNIFPKITYSNCSAQKGWNVKYHKSGKSLCTLYPEKESFIVLIVIKLELADIIKNMNTLFDPAVISIIDSARPFNGTKWVMIPVDCEAIVQNVQEILALKYNPNSTGKTK